MNKMLIIIISILNRYIWW